MLAALAAACGDNLAAPADATAATCTATFTGNFDETSASAADCPTIQPGGLVAADVALDVEIAIATIGTSIGITIDLGPDPTPGTYSSETTTQWSALAVGRVATGACIYSAGGTSVPAGNFTLALDGIDADRSAGHGTLDVLQYVLRNVDPQGHESECGPGDTVHLELVF